MANEADPCAMITFLNGGIDIEQALYAGKEPIFPSSKRLLDDPIVKGGPWPGLQAQQRTRRIPHASRHASHCPGGRADARGSTELDERSWMR
ncbi:Putative amidase [Tolypocladium paradoxum]|uniref:Amidase n=1 Tax=Tolypocladium paradoxum TaxID=94208 RepID=A0A2S4KZE5_9HYPO|nr:Putative amidase [Tolypocladium paradoxum]